jgi:membrane protease YdiL (CAAX protease family)
MILFIRGFYNFLITGSLSNQWKFSNKIFLMNAYVLKGFIYFLFVFIQLLFFKEEMRNENHVFEGDNFIIIFLNVVVLAPILEELFYRYHTKFQIKNIFFSLLAAIILCYDNFIMLFLIISYFMILLAVLKLDIKINRLILVYISSLIFGISHVVYSENSHFLGDFVNSIFIFAPRVFSGLLFCYVFHKKGIFSSIILHSAWNLVPFLLVFLRTQILEL